MRFEEVGGEEGLLARTLHKVSDNPSRRVMLLARDLNIGGVCVMAAYKSGFYQQRNRVPLAVRSLLSMLTVSHTSTTASSPSYISVNGASLHTPMG